MKISHKFGEVFYDFYASKNKTIKTFILLHGAMSVNSIWDYLIDEIRNLGDVYVVSLAGHYPGIISWEEIDDLDKFLNFQHEVLTKILEREKKHKEIILLGHSTGGTISILLKILYPETYNKVIAIVPPIKEDLGIISPLNIPLNFLSHIKIKEDENWFMQNYLLKKIAKNFKDIFFKSVLFFGFYSDDLTKNQEAEVNKFIEGIKKQRSSTLQNVVKITKNAINKYPWLYFSKGEIDLENEALIIGAKEDRMIPVSHHREAAEKIKAQYFEIEKGGHFCLIENKKIIIEKIEEFFNN